MREAARDRISDLPDSLIHHIHSFLETQDAALTSVLSKRWNYIWTTVPVLEFRNWAATSSSGIYKFVDFVDGTLHRHNSSNIDKFSLHWIWQLEESTLYEFFKSRVHSWISIVTKGEVKDLSLYLYHQTDPWFIPLSLFTSESVTSLQLQTRPNIFLPKYISLPRLKRLELRKFEFSDKTWNEELFSNSLLLEELILEFCMFHVRNFSISIPTLKLLQLTTAYCAEDGLWDCVYEIDAPKLVTFSYSGCVAKKFVLSSFVALDEANVCFDFLRNFDIESTAQLLRALAHVKFLTVNNQTLQAICCASYQSTNLLTFPKVKMLKISDSISITSDQGLITLLKAAPNLDSLVFNWYMRDEIEEVSFDDDENGNDDSEGDGDDDGENHSNDSEGVEDEDDDDDSGSVDSEGDGDDSGENDSSAYSVESENNGDSGDERDAVEAAGCEDNYDNEDDSLVLHIVAPECLFPNLKSVCFQQFVGNPREMKWVRQILRDAKALQMMTISFCKWNLGFVNVRSEKEVMVEIPSYPRASLGCVIKFCSRD